MPFSCLHGMLSPPSMESLSSNDESLVFGEVVDEDDKFLSRFFTVEFQKFFISLSVLPGKRAAIWDHLRWKWTQKFRLSTHLANQFSQTEIVLYNVYNSICMSCMLIYIIADLIHKKVCGVSSTQSADVDTWHIYLYIHCIIW